MSYTVEAVNDYTKKLSFELENPSLDKQINEELKKAQKTTVIKGYRKGKAPMSVIESLYKAKVHAKALENFVYGEFESAVTKENITAIDAPVFTNAEENDGKMTFEVMVEVFPEFEPNDLQGESFTKETFELKDDEIENVIKSRLEEKATLEEREDRKVEKGLHAVVDFQGSWAESGEEIPETKGQEVVVEVGAGRFIPGFEDGILGLGASEENEFEVEFPETYQLEKLQGAKVKFKVKVLEIKEKVYPELTDELAKELKFESAEQMKESLKEGLVKQKENLSVKKLNDAIVDRLVSENKFEVSNRMLEGQKKALKEEVTQSLRSQGMPTDDEGDYFNKWEEEINEKALSQVKSAIILESLARKYDITVGNDELESKYQEIADSSGMELQMIKDFYSKNQQVVKNLLYGIREERIIDKVKEGLQIEEKVATES